jgi:hypothetical protein
MSRNRVRYGMIGLLAVAAVLSVVGKKLDSPLVGWLSFVAFAGAVFLYVTWRRQVAARRRATVFDREAKTDETRTGPDE